MREITSASNAFIKEMKSLKEKKYRERLGKYMIEGEKTVMDALTSAVLIEAVITCDPRAAAVTRADAAGLDVVVVPRKVLEQIGDTKTPPDVLACLRRQAWDMPTTGRFYVVADGISDPKNLGTIIRTADAAGADGMLISDDSADPFGPKCQRAAMGSMFHIAITVGDSKEFLEEFKQSGGTIIAGMLEGSDMLDTRFNRACVVVGNESRGVRESTRELASIAYRIPIYGRCESLNAAVAAGIMMYDIRRRLV